MFFARVRWVGRVLDGAGIDTNSKTGRELSTALLKFSKYGQEKNRRGEGARGARLDLGPAEWAVLGAIFAPEDPRVAEHIAEAPYQNPMPKPFWREREILRSNSQSAIYPTCYRRLTE